MSLVKYRKKRSFEETPEPLGKGAIEKGLPVFVIQKHAAKSLHYDLRLEHKGALLSWAVPKGPSKDPKDKRLAIQVEDHPMEYRHFEGIIPKGNYGAGTVEIWDKGTFSVNGASSKKQIEAEVEKMLKKGHLTLSFHGERLNGAYDLVRIKSDPKNWLLIKSQGKSSSMPGFIKPMLATLIDKPFDDPEWLFELKWDGYRTLAYLDHGVQLYSRNEHSFNELFPDIVEELEKWKMEAIFDGEVVILNEKGLPSFQLMQNYKTTRQGQAHYFIFDLLFFNGKDYRNEPLVERKKILRKVLKKSSLISLSEDIEEKGILFFKKAEKIHLEGLVGKRMSSFYVSKRSSDWVKIKTQNRQEVVIGGFTEPRGSREGFGALLVGVYDEEGHFNFVGHVGTGFDDKLLRELHQKMVKLKIAKSPFDNNVKLNMPATWIKPKLLCEVSFTEWTQDNIMRHPVFEGLRMDKEAKEVKKEVAISHPEKIYWPKEKYSKRDLLEYYDEISNYILPYLKNRPLVLRRFPDGITGENFVQKDTKNLHLPDFIETVKIEHEDKTVHYFVVNNKNSLMYVVNLGSIELHPFHAEIDDLDHPDYFILDLDPEDVPFPKVARAALTIHDRFEEMKIPHYLKTSGGRGLHLYIPLNAKYTTDQVSLFGEALSMILHKDQPEITSLERKPANRQKKIYLDVLQNRAMQTIVAPYSVRGKAGATVSTPLEWKELKNGAEPGDFTIKTVPDRLAKIGDIFKPILGKGFDIASWIKKQG